jgi:hypothetical protein
MVLTTRLSEKGSPTLVGPSVNTLEMKTNDNGQDPARPEKPPPLSILLQLGGPPEIYYMSGSPQEAQQTCANLQLTNVQGSATGTNHISDTSMFSFGQRCTGVEALLVDPSIILPVPDDPLQHPGMAAAGPTAVASAAPRELEEEHAAKARGAGVTAVGEMVLCSEEEADHAEYGSSSLGSFVQQNKEGSRSVRFNLLPWVREEGEEEPPSPSSPFMQPPPLLYITPTIGETEMSRGNEAAYDSSVPAPLPVVAQESLGGEQEEDEEDSKSAPPKVSSGGHQLAEREATKGSSPILPSNLSENTVLTAPEIERILRRQGQESELKRSQHKSWWLQKQSGLAPRQLQLSEDPPGRRPRSNLNSQQNEGSSPPSNKKKRARTAQRKENSQGRHPEGSLDEGATASVSAQDVETESETGALFESASASDTSRDDEGYSTGDEIWRPDCYGDQEEEGRNPLTLPWLSLRIASRARKDGATANYNYGGVHYGARYDEVKSPSPAEGLRGQKIGDAVIGDDLLGDVDSSWERWEAAHGENSSHQPSMPIVGIPSVIVPPPRVRLA